MTNTLVIINESLEKAIDNTDLGFLKKRIYKKILDIIDGQIQVSRLAMEVLPGFVHIEDIRKIKYQLREVIK